MQAYIPAAYTATTANTEAYVLLENPGVSSEIAKRVEEYRQNDTMTLVLRLPRRGW